MGLRGRPPSPERRELEQVAPCTFCGARQGDPCVGPTGLTGRQGSKLAHAPRRRALDPLPSVAEFMPSAASRRHL